MIFTDFVGSVDKLEMMARSIVTKRVLVVEDEPSISQLCQLVLTSEWLSVDIAVNGKAAQDMIENRQYDVCLIDIRMPAMNGIELYQWLQEKHPEMEERVAFTSGDVLGADTQSFVEKTERPFLAKPFVPGQLSVLIEDLLSW